MRKMGEGADEKSNNIVVKTFERSVQKTLRRSIGLVISTCMVPFSAFLPRTLLASLITLTRMSNRVSLILKSSRSTQSNSEKRQFFPLACKNNSVPEILETVPFSQHDSFLQVDKISLPLKLWLYWRRGK
jgi:hypothetical protein